MERLLRLEDIMERYGLRDEKTGRKRMREIGAIDTRPMLVPESAVVRWEQEHIRRKPEENEISRAKRRNAGRAEELFGVRPQPPKPGQMISRIRPSTIRDKRGKGA